MELGSEMNIDYLYLTLKKVSKTLNVPVMDLIKNQTGDPFKILIGTILSARTKDETNAKVCEKLFKKIKNFQDLERVSLSELQKLIYPVGFYITKAKKLKELPKIINEEFNGKIPEEIDDLVKLPGVGRKTANLVRSLAFNKPAICVDTHVHKIFNRLGLIKTKTPLETEMKLREILPKKYWSSTNRYFVAFGQGICVPVSPHCSKCPLEDKCPKIGIKNFR